MIPAGSSRPAAKRRQKRISKSALVRERSRPSEHYAVERMAGSAQALSAAAEPDPIDRPLGDQPATDAIQISCSRMQRRWPADSPIFRHRSTHWENLRGKGFRFGIFRGTGSDARKPRSRVVTSGEIGTIRILGRQRGGVLGRYYCCRIASEIAVMIRVREGMFSTMIPFRQTIIVPRGKICALCGRSHLSHESYFILWNLALPVEPHTHQLRPTLRDGH